MYGNSNTSLIDGESVNSITNLSIPIPRPPVGAFHTLMLRCNPHPYHELHHFLVLFQQAALQNVGVDQSDRLIP